MALTFNRLISRIFMRSASSYVGLTIHDSDSQLSFKKKIDKSELKKKLTPIQYDVTQNQGTERPYTNQYCDLEDDGIYKCIACDENLFSSNTKYHSGSGWPSFYDAVKRDNLTYIRDYHIGYERIEVRCGNCGSHLGHLFNDGPKPTNIRYCINSASLNFEKDQNKT